jgi:hypothetical protein
MFEAALGRFHAGNGTLYPGPLGETAFPRGHQGTRETRVLPGAMIAAGLCRVRWLA